MNSTSVGRLFSRRFSLRSLNWRKNLPWKPSTSIRSFSVSTLSFLSSSSLPFPSSSSSSPSFLSIPSSSPFSSLPTPPKREPHPKSKSPSIQPQNLIEKIVQKYSLHLSQGQIVQQGDFVSIQPEHVMTHDNTAAVMTKFESIGAKSIKNSYQPIFTLDHDVQNESPSNLIKYDSIKNFALTHGITFFPAGRGIGHQILIEEGLAYPYEMTVASDSHSNMYGGIGCLGTPVVRTDAASIWITGQTWWQVPKISKVTFTGKMRRDWGVCGKDVILSLCGFFKNDEVLNHAIEFHADPDTLAQFSVEERLTISNMTTEWGALAGVFPVDQVTLNYLSERIPFSQNPSHQSAKLSILKLQIADMNPDLNAHYVQELSLNLNSITPTVTLPNTLRSCLPIRQFLDEFDSPVIDKAYLLSCVNGRLDDLRIAASILKGHQVKPWVEFYIAPASSQILESAIQEGIWQDLLDSGARPLPAGCGPCIGLGKGLVKAGQVAISATNRNFKGRMGDPSALCYLSSPAIVATSAVLGRIAGPWEIEKNQYHRIPDKLIPQGSLTVLSPKTNSSSITSPTSTSEFSEQKKREKRKNHETLIESACFPGFPKVMKGGTIFVDQDSVNTDVVYPGKYTYREDMTREMMKRVAMENYDENFEKVVQMGDFLLSGYTFGCGSSREQAATAILSTGIQLILAGSFSETFKRNSLNNGLLCLECPKFLEDVRVMYPTKILSRRLDGILEILPVDGKLVWTCPSHFSTPKIYSIQKVGKAAQELVVAGGLENWIKLRL